MANKTAQGLVDYALAQVGKPYWYGTFGNKPTLELLGQKSRQYSYPKFSSYSPARMPKFRRHIGAFDRVHDCIGLVKGYIWSDTHNSAPKYNAAQDKSANQTRAISSPQPFGTIPQTPGVLVFFDGHVGIYDGRQTVIEARGSDYGVVKTALRSRPWTHWGYCPWIDYGNGAAPAEEQWEYKINLGDTLWALASRYLGAGSRWTELKERNGIIDERKLPVGMVIQIPGRRPER